MNGKSNALRKSVRAVPASPSPTRQLMRLLVRASHAVEDRWEEALAQAELSGPKFVALTVLVEAGEPLSLSELASKLTCVRSNITQLVDRLEADRLVRRVEDPTDRRGKRAEITVLGAQRQAAGERQVQKVLKDLDGTLAGHDYAVVERMLSALI
jgi:DNA-binding MarR family transcriptional regulator